MTDVVTQDMTSLNEVGERVRQIADAAMDMIGDTRAMALVKVGPGGRDAVRLELSTPEGVVPIALYETAHEQLAAKTDIPLDYYRRMLEGQPDLLADNVNRWLRAEPKKRLLRMLAPITEQDGQRCAEVGARAILRGVLSEQYRPLDNVGLLNTVLPVAAERGLRVAEYALDERRFVLRLMGQDEPIEQRAAAIRARQPAVGDHFTGLNEVVAFGVTIQNSEIGYSALSVAGMVRVLKCVNLYHVDETFGVRHVGRRRGVNGEGDDGEAYFAADTRRADDASVFLKVRDRVIQVLSDESFLKAAQIIGTAQGTPIALPDQVPLFEFVQGVGRKFDLTERETALLGEETAKAVGADRLTRWALGQGFTAAARRLGAGDEPVPMERKVEMERMGWTVLTDQASAFVAEVVRNVNRKN